MTPNSFTYRQTLQIVIPGTFFVSMIIPLIADKFDSNNIESGFQNVVIITVSSILIGICIYAIEIPKQIWFFKKYLPTERIDKNEYRNYFNYYDEKVSKNKREIIERYTGLFHLCINIAFATVVLLVIYLIYFGCNLFQEEVFFILLFTLFFAIVGSVLMVYGHKKIKHEFDSQLKGYSKYKDSNVN